MSYEIILTELFKKEAKKLAKKYPGLKDDLKNLEKELKHDPFQGDSLGRSCYKVRMQITGKHSGKSGGGRVITYVKVIDKIIYLLSIYDKSYKEDLEEKELDKLLKNLLGK